LIEFKALSALLLNHLFEVVDAFGAHIHSMLKRLEVFEEIPFDLAYACPEAAH
jgi:hypothetical protein